MKALWCGLVCGLALAVTLAGCTEAMCLRDRGIAEFQIGRTAEARKLLKQSLDLNSSDAEALYYMGRALHADGHHEQAVYYYQSCLQAKPGHRAAQEWLGKAMAAQEPWGRTMQYVPETQPLIDLPELGPYEEP